MGKVILNWTYESDMIECPDSIADNISEYVSKFDKWLSDKNNQHGYWVKDCFDNDAICFGSEAFVDWLNQNAIQPTDKKVTFVKRGK